MTPQENCTEAESWRQFAAKMAAHFAAEQVAPPPGLSSRIAAVVRHEAQVREGQARYRAWLAVLLASVVVLVALLMWIVVPQHALATLRASTAASGAPATWLPVLIWAILGVAVCYAFLCAEIDWTGMRFSRRRWL